MTEIRGRTQWHGDLARSENERSGGGFRDASQSLVLRASRLAVTPLGPIDKLREVTVRFDVCPFRPRQLISRVDGR